MSYYIFHDYEMKQPGADLRGGCWGELTPGGGVGGVTPLPRILGGGVPPHRISRGGSPPPPMKQLYFANYKDIFDNKKSLFTH